LALRQIQRHQVENIQTQGFGKWLFLFSDLRRNIDTRYVHHFGITRGAVSGVFSVYMLLCCLLAILGGWAMDRYGPRKVGVFMGTLTGLSFLLTSLAWAPWQLLITYSLLLALGTGPLYAVVNATTSRWFVKKRGLAVGFTSAGGGVGTIFIAPFSTFLILSFVESEAT